MTIFDCCFDITVGQEGETLDLTYSDYGNWTGGHVGIGVLKGSRYGISAASYPNVDIANLTKAAAKLIYVKDYFRKAQCDLVFGPLAALMFDSAVNNGPGRAPIWLQHTLGVAEDGRIGPRSLAMLKGAWKGGAGRIAVCSAFQAQRLRYMAGLSTWDSNAGWAKRLIEVPMLAMAVPDSDP